MPIFCKLICQSSTEHLSQIFTGFGLLEKVGILKIQLSKDKNYRIGVVGKPVIKIIINNHIKVVYDTFDGSVLFPEELDWCDFYFKRSFDKELISSLGLTYKVFPYGFNYSIYGPNDHVTLRNSWIFSSIFKQKAFTEGLIHFVRNDKLLSLVFKTNNGRYISSYKNFESIPRLDLEPKIIFFARLWDPSTTKSEELKYEREQINEMRSQCIRKLKGNFGPSFYGGLESTPYALSKFSDLVVKNPKLTSKREYLNLLDSSAICVATKGILGSNGWKLAEYIAGSKAIVSEKFKLYGSRAI